MRAASIFLGLAIAAASAPVRAGTALFAAGAQGIPLTTVDTSADRVIENVAEAESANVVSRRIENFPHDATAVICSTPVSRYPPESLRRGEQGTVQVRVRIGPDGIPIDASVVTSSGFARLDDAAQKAVFAWTFKPELRNGVAVENDAIVPITFTLENETSQRDENVAPTLAPSSPGARDDAVEPSDPSSREDDSGSLQVSPKR